MQDDYQVPSDSANSSGPQHPNTYPPEFIPYASQDSQPINYAPYDPVGQQPVYTQPNSTGNAPYTQPPQRPYYPVGQPMQGNGYSPNAGYPQGSPYARPPYNYYQQQQPGYMPPIYPPAVSPARPGDGLGVASLVLGIVSVVLAAVPFLGLLLAVVGLVLGIIAKVKGSGGLAIAGIILSSIGVVIGLLIAFAIIYAITVNESSSSIDRWNTFAAMISLLH